MSATRAAPRRPAAAQVGRGVLGWIERRLGLTPAGVAVSLGATASIWLAVTLGSRALMLLAYGALLTVGLAWVLGRRTLDVVATRSDLPSRVRQGQTVDVTLQLTARSRLATLVIEESLPAAVGEPRRVAVPLLAAGRTLEHSYRLLPRRRGAYDVGPLLAEWSDPFGLTRRRRTLLDATPILVHPAVERVADRVSSRAWEDPPIRPPVSKPWPTGFEFYGMRDYVFGDDPRRIVWRATARTLDLDTGDGRYLVREAEQGITDLVKVFLDTDVRSHDAGDPSESFETLVRAAASIGVHHLEEGFALSVDTNAALVEPYLRGRRSQVRLLDRLAAMEPEQARLSGALDRLLVGGNGGSTHNVVLTPHLDADTTTRLRLLLDRGRSILLVLLVGDDPDPVVLHRAGSLGCPLVELRPNTPFGPAFRRMVAAR